MSECELMRERMPLLLTEALPSADREATHAHIERCPHCDAEWNAYRDTWSLLGDVPDVPVPSRVRARFLAEIEKMSGQNVVTFERREKPFRRWIAQAAAAVILVSGSFFAGRATLQSDQKALADAVRKNSPFRIAESVVVPAANIEPEILGRPEIRNIQFTEPVASTGDDIGMSFDMTSRVTITGKPHDKTFVKLLSYVMQDRTRSSHLRSETMQWVKNTYGNDQSADPALVDALANVLKNETHEGVRLKAAETLRALPSSGGTSAQAALIEALQNDPNPAVRIKAVEALAALTKNGNQLDPATVDTLKRKAGQEDENPYVRVKAAEALSQVNL